MSKFTHLQAISNTICKRQFFQNHIVILIIYHAKKWLLSLKAVIFVAVIFVQSPDGDMLDLVSRSNPVQTTARRCTSLGLMDTKQDNFHCASLDFRSILLTTIKPLQIAQGFIASGRCRE